jgi:uncharacterized SAM-binding protein YcdF (DUF218 family)
VSDFVWFLFSVGGLIVLMLFGALWLRARPHSPRARRFLLILAVAYTIASIYATSYGVGRLLVIGLRPLEPSDVPDGRTAIVVLGSGSYTAHDWEEQEFSIVDPPAAARVVEAFRVYRLVDPDWVISSGGKRLRNDPNEATGITMRDALVQLGVDPSRLLVETKSRNTHEESVVVASLLASLRVNNVILVTSDTHMRRSLGTFRAQGVDAIPAIARTPYDRVRWFSWTLPSDAGLWHAGAVAHEFLGIGYYAIRGWYRF